MASGLLSMLAKLDHPSKEGPTIAIDMCLIFRYGRVPGPELTRSKAGTDLLEYITAQCVDEDPGPVLGCIPVPAGVPDMDIDRYGARRGIETGHPMIGAVRTKTRSRGPGARLLCFPH